MAIAVFLRSVFQYEFYVFDYSRPFYSANVFNKKHMISKSNSINSHKNGQASGEFV